MKHFIGFIIVLLYGLQLSAQVAVEKSNTVIKSEGKSYYVHTVKQGQTLYSVSKAYDVSQKEILKANDIEIANIKVGQKLMIPVLNPVDNQAADEAKFRYHKIEKGETLYSIAKRYNVATETLLAFNPKSRYGLQIGQILTIPNNRQGHADQEDSNFHYHTVVSGETLFSLAQQYGISIKQIQLFNPETKTELKAGTTLKLPKSSYSDTEKLPISKYGDPIRPTGIADPNYFVEEGVIPCFDFQYRSNAKFKVALMLPLFIEQNLQAIRNYDGKPGSRKFIGISDRFVEFYEGTLLAVNQLKYEGVSIDLHVFDTQNSETEVYKILNDNDFSTFDLIIGPVYSKNFKIVARAAKRYRTNIISPLSKNTGNLINNPFAFQAIPSDATQIRRTSDLISKLYDSTVVIVHNGTKEELSNIEIYKNKMVKSFASRDDIDEIAVKVIDFNFGGKKTLEDAFSLAQKNIVLIPDNKEAFVTNVVEQLYLFSEDYDITLIGSPNWENFQNINISHLRRMSFNYTSPFHVDYKHWKTKQFIKKYRNTYKTEPGLSAFQGYDISYFFLSALKDYGKNFQFCLQKYDKQTKQKGIIFDFNFSRTGTFNGFENKGVHFLTYDTDYQLKQTRIQ